MAAVFIGAECLVVTELRPFALQPITFLQFYLPTPVPQYNRNPTSLHVQKRCNAFFVYEAERQSSISASETFSCQLARMGSDYENYYGCTSVAGIDLFASRQTRLQPESKLPSLQEQSARAYRG